MAVALACFALAIPKPTLGAWKTFTPGDGLPSNAVSWILEDRFASLWFAGDHGVSRYDGAWRTFTMADGVASSEATCLLEDRTGNIWVGTRAGVSRYDGSTWRTFTTADGLASNVVNFILEDRAGNLWLACGFSVSRYDPSTSTWRTFTIAGSLANTGVNCILEDRAGNLWFGGGGGASRFDPSTSTWRTFTHAPFGDGLACGSVACMAEDRDGSLWFGGTVPYQEEGGVSRYDPSTSTWRTFTLQDGLASTLVHHILTDRAGNMWFACQQELQAGGYAGVSRYDGSTWQTFNTADGLPNDVDVNFIFQDGEGNLWFATGGGGASRFDGSTWRTFIPGTFPDAVLSIWEDRTGNLWFATGLGVSRYDGSTWRTFTPADGLASYSVRSISEDRAGNLWFATDYGASRYDGSTWRTFRTADGMITNDVQFILEDRVGNLWFACVSGNVSQPAGVSRYDPSTSTWRTFTTADGLASNFVSHILEDSSGSLWFATADGASRYDGSTWRTFTTAHGLAYNSVQSILEDRSGSLWFATLAGVSRYDGSTWRTFTTADGLAHNQAHSIIEDRAGNLWLATRGGASRYDGSTWRTFTAADGLAINQLHSCLEDRAGNMWFGTAGAGASRYAPDRVPPRTVFQTRPPRLTSSRIQGASFAAFGESDWIEFSYRLGGGAWSEWSSTANWLGKGLQDGVHVLEARSRDFLSNVDSSAAVTTFEIDATPPAPVLASPSFGQAVRGSVEIRGTAVDARFMADSVWVRPAGAGSWFPPAATLLTRSSTQVSDGALANWDTSGLPDGAYDIRVSVSDSLGLTGSTQVTVIVDNDAPFADQTAPAKVTAATGGDVFTTNAETHLYFPPHAFAQDAIVMVVALDGTSVPSSLPSGGVKVLDGYELTWAGALKKAARFTLSYAGAVLPTGTLAIYRSGDGTAWERLGGTVDANQNSVSLAVMLPGRYALFADNGLGAGTSSLSKIAFTPRVFSPTGGFADRQLGISFRLGKPAPVTVKVFSASGRFIREVAAGVQLNAGENLIRWDGTDRNGGYVVDGMYFVTVEALGHTETKTLAVVK